MAENMDYMEIDFEIKGISEDDGVGTFEGYASTFGNIDRVGDIVQPGAFKSAKASSTLMLWNHNSSDVIGGWTDLREDDKGLYVKGELNLEVQRGAEAYSLLKKKHIKAMSVGYRIAKNGSEWKDDGTRHLTKLDLFEVSLVAVPANPKARIGRTKSIDGITIRDFESELREAGFSRGQACKIVGMTKRHFDFSNADERDAEGQSLQRDAGIESETISKLKQLRDALASF